MQNSMQTPLNPLIIVINRDRDELYERINKRVDIMIENGLVNEVEQLVKKFNLTKNNQSMQAIGYKEILDYLNHELTVNEAIEKIKISTRHYAKRQITWFKNQTNGIWINLTKTSTDDSLKQILSLLNENK